MIEVLPNWTYSRRGQFLRKDRSASCSFGIEVFGTVLTNPNTACVALEGRAASATPRNVCHHLSTSSVSKPHPSTGAITHRSEEGEG